MFHLHHRHHHAEEDRPRSEQAISAAGIDPALVEEVIKPLIYLSDFVMQRIPDLPDNKRHQVRLDVYDAMAWLERYTDLDADWWTSTPGGGTRPEKLKRIGHQAASNWPLLAKATKGADPEWEMYWELYAQDLDAPLTSLLSACFHSIRQKVWVTVRTKDVVGQDPNASGWTAADSDSISWSSFKETDGETERRVVDETFSLAKALVVVRLLEFP